MDLGGICIRVETGSCYPGHPGHILSGSSGSDPLYKISGSDPDSSYIVSHALLMAFGPGENGSVFPNSAQYVLNLVIDGL